MRGGVPRQVQCVLEGRPVPHSVVGGHQDHDGIGVVRGKDEGGDGGGGGGVSPAGFQHDLLGGEAELLQLLGDEKAVIGAGNHQRGRAIADPCNALDGFLQHAAFRDQRQQLLGMLRAGQRPQALA